MHKSFAICLANHTIHNTPLNAPQKPDNNSFNDIYLGYHCMVRANIYTLLTSQMHFQSLIPFLIYNYILFFTINIRRKFSYDWGFIANAICLAMSAILKFKIMAVHN